MSSAFNDDATIDVYPPPGDVGEILIAEDAIQTRVAALGQEILADCDGAVPLLIGVLKGSAVFVSDLMRAIAGPVEVDFMAVSSYGDATQSSGIVRIIKDLDSSITGRHVVLVEDIIDSGLTMAYLVEHLAAQNPASLKTCSLLVREGRQAPEVSIDYVGFEIPPAFVVGYGLDVAQRYRNLPYVGVFTGEVDWA